MAPKKKRKTEVGSHSVGDLPGASTANDLSKIQKLALSYVRSVENDIKNVDCDANQSLPQICGQAMSDPMSNVEIVKALMNLVGVSCGKDDELLTRLAVWPPSPGDTFKTNPLLWDFCNADTWWRGEPDCEATFAYARSMISDEFLQDKSIQCRCVCDVPPISTMHLGTLKHGPGQQRSLAACIALIAYIHIKDSYSDLTSDDWTHPLVVKSVSSLMAIPTLMYTSRGNEVVDRMVMVALQNRESNIEPVSSWSWYNLLKNLECSAKQAVERYNALPEVQAYASSDTPAGEKGADSALEVHVDEKRLYAIDGWLRKSTDEIRDMMTQMLKHESWSNIMVTDKVLCNPWVWVGSTADFAATTSATDVPITSEESVAIDWSLPMTQHGHTVYMTRLRLDFKRASMLVSAGDKKKYRRKMEKAEELRNMMCLASQLQPWVATQSLSEASEFMDQCFDSDRHDSFLIGLVRSKPQRFFLSMIPGLRQCVSSHIHGLKVTALAPVSKEILKVLEAEWNLFKSQVAEDHTLMLNIRAASDELSATQRAWTANKQAEHRQNAANAMNTVMETFLPMKQSLAPNSLTSSNLLVNEKLVEIARVHKCGVENVLVLINCDFNTPHTMSDVKQKSIAQFCKDVCGTCGSNRAALVLLNMVPQDHSPLGLEDDHMNIHSTFHDVGMLLPESFVLPFKLHPRSAAKGTMKNYIDGRFGVIQGNKGDNAWLLSSHLAGPGIEVDEVAKLPPRSALHSLASVDADKDISTSDRNTVTSAYQQRGCDHTLLFLKTALKNMHHEHVASPPILIVEPCMHVGDLAIAVHKSRIQKPLQYGSTLYYHGIARDGMTLEFCQARVKEEMVDDWFNKSLVLTI